MTGSEASSFNQMYRQNGTLIDKKPLYVSSNGVYGIWFNGDTWWFGDISNLDEGKFNLGYLYKESTDCPSSSKRWYYWNGREWAPDEHVHVSCDAT